MINLATQQAKFRDKRREQLERQRDRYAAEQALQLVGEEIAAKVLATGVADLPSNDPLKVRQASLAASLPGLRDAAESAAKAVRGLFDELYTDPDFTTLVAQLQGDVPVLLFPVRLETRFCRIRHYARPVTKDWLLDFSGLAVPDSLRGWGLQIETQGTALQIRAPFPGNAGMTEAQFKSLAETAIKTGAILPPNGQWLQRKPDISELRIRILPDDLHIDSFEEGLTPPELARGQQFWQRIWKSDKPETAWDELRGFFSTPRSAWIVRQTRPSNFKEDGPQQGQPQFPTLKLRANNYTQAPKASAMPDFFVAILYKPGQPERVVRGQLIVGDLAAGFDPNEPDPTAFQPDASGDLKFPEALRWIFDFDEAEKRGLGIRVPLSVADLDGGYDKLIVLGMKLSAGKEEGKEQLERLFQSQLYSEKGMFVLPQGTPTNNFESAKSGFNRPDHEAAQYFKATWKGGPHWTDAQRNDIFSRPDGLQVTQLLGIDEDLSRKLPGAEGEDVRESLAMNRLLYPGTLGYWLRQFFSPPLLEADLDAMQAFLERFVTGRGHLPALRIGSQPYGILPATAFKFWKSKNPAEFSQRLFEQILKKLDPFWDALKGQLLFAGDGRVPANPLSEDLMRLAGTDPTSSRFAQQAIFGEGHLNFMLRLNRFAYLGLPGGDSVPNPPVVNSYQSQVEPELRLKGWDLGSFASFRFMHMHPNKRQLNGPLIEELPVGEDRPLANFLGSPWNYLDWLVQSSLDDLWKEQFQAVPLAPGTPTPTAPQALLFHIARFALRRGALEAALRLLEPDEKLRLLKGHDIEVLSLLPDEGAEFNPAALNDINVMHHTLRPLVKGLGISKPFTLIPDRFNYFGQSVGTPPVLVKERLKQGDAPPAAVFAKQRQAAGVLRGLPTARLERLFCEHLDSCSHRLDSWFSGLVLERLGRQRTAAVPSAQGIYLGAFGYLENVRPSAPATLAREVAPEFSAQLDTRTVCFPFVSEKHLRLSGLTLEQVLPNAFVYLGDSPSEDFRFEFSKRRVVPRPKEAPGNQGFIHGPSPEHADTAAILRAGWQSRQAEGGNEANTLAVRLDARRVQGALALLEGIGQGDSLAALLGYQLERKLHDHRMDPITFKLRRLFPLKTDQAANAFATTTDGVAVLDAWKASPAAWGGAALTAQDIQQVEPLLVALNDQFDALSDLMLTESVFQTVKGSTGRAAAALRTLNASGQVHQPEVVRTPQRGSLVTFRTGVVFPGNNFLAKWGKTPKPRTAVSPLLNNWLGGQLPDPKRVVISANVDEVLQKITLADCDVQPLELLVMFPEPRQLSEQRTALAWVVQAALRKKLALPVGAKVTLDFTRRSELAATEFTLFEISPLVIELRRLLAAARTLTPGDFLREGGQGVAPVLNVAAPQQALVKIVKTDRLPEKLAARVLQARTDLESKLETEAAVRQTAWSALLEILAECGDWRTGNQAVGTAVAFDESQAALLLKKAADTAADCQKMQADADALVTQLTSAPAADKPSLCERLGDRLFGTGFRITPTIKLTNAPVVEKARTADLSKNLDALSLEEWLRQSALVHPVARLYRQCMVLREALAAPVADLAPTVVQLNTPAAQPGYWIGAPMLGGPGEVSQTFGGTLSLVLEVHPAWKASQTISGLIYDEWTELLPDRETTTGVALHFNQPDTEPPQVMMLVVNPAEGENWRWEFLPETILDTFERARKRLLTFENLKTNTALAHLLPALVAPLERDNLGPTLDMGRNNVAVTVDARGAAPLVSL